LKNILVWDETSPLEEATTVPRPAIFREASYFKEFLLFLQALRCAGMSSQNDARSRGID